MPFSANRQKVIAARLSASTGYEFIDLERLDRALTHSSARNHATANYERLEFLGDRVLGLVVAELLFAAFPEADEGDMSLRFNQLVDAKTCAEIAMELEIPKLLRAGSDLGSTDSKRLVSVRADVVEALVAAIYLDGGLDAARAFITKFWGSRINEAGSARRDAKTELQEWAHRDSATAPVYAIVSREGPDHDPHFEVSVSIGLYPLGTGHGRSKRLAEQDAARQFLIARSVWAPEDNI